jgi:hypothetical protein
VSGQLHAPASLPLGKEPPGTHSIGGWVGLRASLDDVKKRKFLILPGLELRPLGHPARSKLYRLRYPATCPYLFEMHFNIILPCMLRTSTISVSGFPNKVFVRVSSV